MKANIEFTVPVASCNVTNKAISHVTLTLHSSEVLEARGGNDHLQIKLGTVEPAAQLNINLIESSQPSEVSAILLATMADYLFSRSETLEQLHICHDLLTYLHAQCQANGLVNRQHTDGSGVINRAAFYQNGLLWLWKGSHCPAAETWAINDKGIRHPQRQPQPDGVIYQRYDFTSDLLVTLESLDPDKHLDLFHNWMNQPRVAEFWELDKSKDELREYIQKQRDDEHSWPVLVSFDGKPLGYIELYWVAEDRLAPYYDSHAWDRGAHVLVGNTNFLGPRYSRAWTFAMTHFMFLDDPRTRTLAGEPRSDNKRLLKLMDPASWFFVKEFDFPHKRSALIHCQRDTFFQKVRL